MSFMNPIWLWGLGALSIPVGIHLLSRKEGKTIRIGSIRFLTETSTSKFSSLRLNEVALLAVRSLLVTLIVLFLAGLWIEMKQSKASRKWVLVEKGLMKEAHIKAVIDSLQKNEFEVRELAIDFPVPDSDTTETGTDYYKLAEDLSKEIDLRAIVLSTNSLSGFKGKRNPLPENITWLTYPRAVRQSLPDTRLTTKSDTLWITLAYDKEFQHDKDIIRAALNIIRDAAPKQLIVTETDTRNFQAPDRTDWVFWLSDEKPVNNGNLLYFSENTLGNLIENSARGRWVLTQHVTTTNAIEQHLPLRLIELLFQQEIKSELIRQDTRTVPNEMAWSDTRLQSNVTITSGKQLDRILFVCITLLFIIERVLAFYRKQ